MLGLERAPEGCFQGCCKEQPAMGAGYIPSPSGGTYPSLMFEEVITL
jgi:hypothetical protein